ncbi:hypothetical protein EVAR_17266_1 [Eumeta japonica]|uniref:Uncharacterized protein n=1 Tax=Eumeta variegata TaxID=151549 RepID=A0A4C1TSZ5_EUMVA|nr:hypothetical protein EVAR_17266_1 [Eumeta japonica]
MYSIIEQRIRAVFAVVGIVLECTLTVIGFQGLMMEPEGSDNGDGNLEAPSSDPESQLWSKYISRQFQQTQIRIVRARRSGRAAVTRGADRGRRKRRVPIALSDAQLIRARGASARARARTTDTKLPH